MKNENIQNHRNILQNWGNLWSTSFILYFSLTHPYITHCVEIIIYYFSISSINFITRLNLRPLLICFFFWGNLKLWNVCIWLSSHCKTLPDCRGSYSQRDIAKGMERKWERTNVNRRCVSVYGVKLWNECNNELKKVNWRSNNKKDLKELKNILLFTSQ